MFITKFIGLQNQIRIFHWQTKSYSEHQAFGALYEGLTPLIDEFVEVYLGKYGVQDSTENFEFSLQNYSSASPVSFIDSNIYFLTNDIPAIVNPDDTDLLNIRDEMLALLNKTKYLITLR
jgi:hypothetical protein